MPLTVHAIEERKARIDFDAALLALLLPEHHRKASLRRDSTTESQLRATLSRLVNPIICEFVTTGCKKIPRRVYAGRVVRLSRRYRFDQQVRSYLHTFVRETYLDLARVLEHKRARKAGQLLAVALEEAITRSRIVLLLTRN